MESHKTCGRTLNYHLLVNRSHKRTERPTKGLLMYTRLQEVTTENRIHIRENEACAEDDVPHGQHIKAMKNEHAKIKHNMTKAAELITLTYAGRRKEVNSDTGVKDLIDKHPFHTNYGEVIAYKIHYTKCTVLAAYRVHFFVSSML